MKGATLPMSLTIGGIQFSNTPNYIKDDPRKITTLRTMYGATFVTKSVKPYFSTYEEIMEI